MKFSLFYEMQISHPTRETERQLFHDCLEQAVLADACGYHCIWAVEHHGLYEYSHSSAPEIFLSFVAAKTQRIRIGHGISLLPFRYNHPIRVAERIAALDILSNGRVNWGSGKSGSMVEKKAFENDLSTLDDQWREALVMIPQMWKADVFEYKGQFFDIPPTQIVPKPVQQPHPPMFASCANPHSASVIGELGLGVLNFSIGSDESLQNKILNYRRSIETAKPVHFQKNNHFACTAPCLVLEDDHKACAHGYRGGRFFQECLNTYYYSQQRPIGPLAIDRGFFPQKELAAVMALRNVPGAPLSSVVGDPTSALEAAKRFQEIGVDELILIMQMGTVAHELIMESIQLFADKVMSHF